MSMMNFPVNGTSSAQTKSSLLLSCLSVTSAEREGDKKKTSKKKTRGGSNPVSRVCHPSEHQSRRDFIDTIKQTFPQLISVLSQSET
ncbi:hypothetical protein Leryth_005105 [Lithospermum erythrorhizon]|nr:hypothetical protein Leryth_005105 [Lithospermum erythrorhizon]